MSLISRMHFSGRIFTNGKTLKRAILIFITLKHNKQIDTKERGK